MENCNCKKNGSGSIRTDLSVLLFLLKNEKHIFDIDMVTGGANEQRLLFCIDLFAWCGYPIFLKKLISNTCCLDGVVKRDNITLYQVFVQAFHYMGNFVFK